eukprot:4896207-Alexandrium_andersonii.AAC.1
MKQAEWESFPGRPALTADARAAAARASQKAARSSPRVLAPPMVVESVRAYVPGLSEEKVLALVRENSRASAIGLANGEDVTELQVGQDNLPSAVCRGSEGRTYKVQVEKRRAGAELGARCECADYQKRGGLCKHGAATLIVLGKCYAAQPHEVRSPEDGCWAALMDRAPAPRLSQLRDLAQRYRQTRKEQGEARAEQRREAEARQKQLEEKVCALEAELAAALSAKEEAERLAASASWAAASAATASETRGGLGAVEA